MWLALPVFILLTGMSAMAQTAAQRQSLVNALNQAIAGGYTYVSPFDDETSFEVKGHDGGCDLLELFVQHRAKKKEGDGGALQTFVEGLDISYDYDKGTFTICVVTKPAHTVPVTVNSLPMVADLNNWIDRAWGIDLQDLPGLGSIPFYSSCANSIPAQRFYRWSLADADADAVQDAYEHATSASTILSTDYVIMGNTVHGSSIFSFYTPPSFGFIADRLNSIVKPHSIFLKIVPPGSGGSYDFNADIYQDSYGGSDCGMVNGNARLLCTFTGNACRLEAHFDSATVEKSNQGLFDYFSNDSTFTDLYGQFGNDDEGWLTFTFIPNVQDPCSTATTTRIMRLVDNQVPADVCCTTYPMGGTFGVDTLTGQLVYHRSSMGGCGTCCDLPVPCIQFCHDSAGYEELAGVLDDYAQTYADGWSEPDTPAPLDGYEFGSRGIWRPVKYSGYKTTIISGTEPGLTTPHARTYTSAGVLNDFRLFNWRDEDANFGTKWLKRDSVTQYSPLGAATEQRDALGVVGSAGFGYHATMPIFVAQNAPYGSVLFESFEDGKGNAPGVAHAGTNSRHITSSFTLPPVKIFQQDVDMGIQVRFWAKHSNLGYPDVVAAVTSTPDIGDGIHEPKIIAHSGDWALYERVYQVPGTLINSTVTFTFTKMVSDQLWLDDIRVQPYVSQVNCYVYDPNTLRPSATFDDQHFGLYYQYDGQGRLLRKIRETERGIKTIAEAEYHTPLIDRTTTFDPRVKRRDEGGGTSAAAASADMESGADSTGRIGTGGKFDLLDFKAGPDSQSLKIFGSEHPKVPDLDSLTIQKPELKLPASADSNLLKLPGLNRLPLEKIPLAERAEILEQLKGIDEEAAGLLAERSDSTIAPDRKGAIDRGLAALNEKRLALLKEKLGMSDEDARRWYDERATKEKQP